MTIRSIRMDDDTIQNNKALSQIDQSLSKWNVV